LNKVKLPYLKHNRFEQNLLNYSFITEPEFESGGTMVVHSPHHLKFKGSNLTSAVGTRKEKMATNTVYVSECPQFDPLLPKQNPTPML
jgi:hypothetical protein